jgi:hypothetical protein
MQTTAAQNRHPHVYVETATATKVFVGVYSESSGHPDTLLTIGSSTTLRAAAWNTVPVTPFSLVAGTRYWFALLATGGNIKLSSGNGTEPVAGLTSCTLSKA